MDFNQILMESEKNDNAINFNQKSDDLVKDMPSDILISSTFKLNENEQK